MFSITSMIIFVVLLIIYLNVYFKTNYNLVGKWLVPIAFPNGKEKLFVLVTAWLCTSTNAGECVSSD